MAIVTLRYWAAAKEAAGTAEETVTAGTLAEVLAAARGRARPGSSAGPANGADPGGADPGGADPGGADPGERPAQDPGLRTILARSSFLIDGVPVGTRAPETVVLSDAAVIEVLPPFAGG